MRVFICVAEVFQKHILGVIINSRCILDAITSFLPSLTVVIVNTIKPEALQGL